MGVCLPTIGAATKGATGNRGGQGPSTANSSLLASTAVVPSASAAVGRLPAQPAGISQLDLAEAGTSNPRQTRITPATRVEIIRDALRVRGFSEVSATRIAQPQRASTRAIYESKWNKFSRWCVEQSIDPLCASVPQIADFFVYLTTELNLAPSTVEGYRSAISHTLKGTSGRDIGTDKDLTHLLASMHQERPRSRPQPPEWDLSYVLHTLTQAPFEPMVQAPLKMVTWKTVFLVAFASARRRGEIHALQRKNWMHDPDWNSVTLFTDPSFIAKTQIVSSGKYAMQPLVIPSLANYVGPDLPEDKTLCPVRALRYYIQRTDPHRGARTRLFLACVPGKLNDIVPSTLSGWIKGVIQFAYNKGPTTSKTLYNVTPHTIRGMAASWALTSRAPMADIMTATSWRTHNTFTSFYLKDCTNIRPGMFMLGPVVAAGQISSIHDQPNQAPSSKKKGRHHRRK